MKRSEITYTVDVESGNVTVDDCKFEENNNLLGNQPYDGTLCLEVLDQDVAVQKCEFKKNTAPSGGGLSGFDIRGTLSILRSKFEENEGGQGGGVFMRESNSVTITDSIFKKNAAATIGGAVLMKEMSGSITLKNLNVDENSPAVYIGDVAVNVAPRKCSFKKNVALGGIGGLGVNDVDGDVLVDECKFEENMVTNSSNGFGGGLSLDSAQFNGAIQGCEFKKNVGDERGGGFSANNIALSGALSVKNTKFEENEAAKGSAGFVSETDVIDFQSNDEKNNVTTDCEEIYFDTVSSFECKTVNGDAIP